MNLVYTLETKPAEIPPIDVAAPAVFETATRAGMPPPISYRVKSTSWG